jgi:UDP-3-O-[3-hydroxymyristoyl] glucosamine N-acyltransferase
MLAIEHFRLTTPCQADLLPCLATLPELQGKEIHGVVLPGAPLSGFLSYCDRLPRRRLSDASCTATALVPTKLVEELRRMYPLSLLVATDDPRACFIDALTWLQERNLIETTSLLPQPFSVSSSAKISSGAVIESHVCIEAGVRIGSGAVIRSGTWLKAGAIIGENTVIGSVGMNAYVGNDGLRRSFPHVAGVVVGEGVRIGVSSVVVRGILSSTIIGARSTVGNLCNIGHGVVLGEDVWISAGASIGGHTRIGSKATIALACVICDNIKIGAYASIGMGSVVTKDVQTGKAVFGNPGRTFPKLKSGPSR